MKDGFLIAALLSCVIAFLIAADTIRHQAERLYDLEMRLFYLEDVVGYWFYGDSMSEQYQTDFSGGDIE
jgi:hypothetical protein